MPRPRMSAGEMGTVRFVALANGQIEAHARMRDEVGELGKAPLSLPDRNTTA